MNEELTFDKLIHAAIDDKETMLKIERLCDSLERRKGEALTPHGKNMAATLFAREVMTCVAHTLSCDMHAAYVNLPMDRREYVAKRLAMFMYSRFKKHQDFVDLLGEKEADAIKRSQTYSSLEGQFEVYMTVRFEHGFEKSLSKVAPVAPATPVAQPSLNQKEQDQMQTQIESITFINGRRANDYSDDDLVAMISQAEGEIKKMEAIDAKPKALVKKIADHKAFIDGLVKIADARVK